MSLFHITDLSNPEDYDFANQPCGYICGMSVPPIMIKRIVTRLIEHGVYDYKNTHTKREDD